METDLPASTSWRHASCPTSISTAILGLGSAGLRAGQPPRLPNLFLSGRKIGDEFRYILERRYARKLPGNLLERPELLLNPWAVRDTEAGEEKLATGEAYARKAAGRGGVAADIAADPFSDGGGGAGQLGDPMISCRTIRS